jgi:type IV secretory pathway TrbD component
VKTKDWLYHAFRIAFGVILIAASIDKIRYPIDFAEAVSYYRVFGEGLSFWAAVVIPPLEALTGIILLTGLWSDGAVLINTGLMSAFLILVLQAWLRGLDIRCGCFSVHSGTPMGWLKFLENVGFALGAWMLAYLHFFRNLQLSASKTQRLKE